MITIGELWQKQLEQEAAQEKNGITLAVTEQPVSPLKKKPKMLFEVLYVFLHMKFHTDEAVCWWLSRSEAFREMVGERFPSIENAQALFWTWGQTIKAADRADTLSFGCRGGVADEHKLRSREYQQTCAAEMFAYICGLGADPALRAVLAKVVKEDRVGALDKQSIHAVLKQIHRMDDSTRPASEEILAWCAIAYEAEYRMFLRDEKLREENPILTISQARRYIKEICGPEKAEEWADIPTRAAKNAKARMGRMLEKLAQDRELGTQSKYWRTVPYIDQRTMEKHMVPMVVIETDSLEANKAAIDLGAYITVVKRSSGNMVIFTDRRRQIDLTTVAMVIRDTELRLMKKRGGFTGRAEFSPEQLKSRSNVEGWPQFEPYWYLHDVPREAANQLYNGSESAGDVPPTKIPLEEVVAIVRQILGGQYHQDFYQRCLAGKCVENRCPWYRFKLGRCKVVWGEMPPLDQQRNRQVRERRQS